jgi:zinc and cadmium transporter
MTPLTWIVLGGLLMSAIAMVGSVTLLLPDAVLERALKPLVAFAAGSLIGGALFHMLPAAAQGGLDMRRSGSAPA